MLSNKEIINPSSNFRTQQRLSRNRPQSSISSSSGISSTSVSSIQQYRPHDQRQYLTVKKWVIVVLVLMLLMTVSLLVGISLQHFQLLKKFLESRPAEPEFVHTTDSTTTLASTTATRNPTLYHVDESENFIPK